MAHLFAETESGKPRHWGCLMAVIIFITLFNLGIIVVIRVLLDSRDEINELIIKNPRTRSALFAFLGTFTLTFFFGCWCCFCCGGYLCHLLFIAPLALSRSVSHLSSRFIRSHNVPVQRLHEEVDDIDLAELRAHIHSINKQPPQHYTKTDTQPFERTIGSERIIESEACPDADTRLPNQWRGRARAYSIDVGLA
ncbi:hypothetical protein PFISCL1PPCAC_22595 [Pristionchus fissidentatus]|uniref:G protein-coupled receptor n=1 Tax=Pristionchus fissidentatus TaxID=1538716 RepID=A0AAV5WKY5_9BILA|nr:hypothetical protein PFISCL1PPCAC_22595 [Pristionchus fissidentatus]